MRALRVGGRLIYSTCSLEPEENDAVVTQALEGEAGFRLLPWGPQVRSLEEKGTLHPGTAERLFPAGAPDNFLRTFPGQYEGDGFFVACITRDGVRGTVPHSSEA